MEFLKEGLKRYRQIVLYFLIGGFSAGFDYGIFFVLVNVFDIQYLVSNFFSVHCGIVSSFLLNRHFNFKVKDEVISRLLSFYFVGLLGLAVGSGFLMVTVDYLQWDALFAKMGSIIGIALIQFLLNKYITFKISI